MFKRANEEELLQRRLKDPTASLNKLRILEGVPLRKLNDSLSSHSSVAASSLRSSLHLTANSSQFSLRSSLLARSTPPKQPTREEAAQNLL